MTGDVVAALWSGILIGMAAGAILSLLVRTLAARWTQRRLLRSRNPEEVDTSG